MRVSELHAASFDEHNESYGARVAVVRQLYATLGKNAPQISQGSQKGHYVRLLLLAQLPIEHEIKIFYRVLQRE